MLSKMGWRKGEGLGRTAQGMTEPINAVTALGGQLDGERRGLGAAHEPSTDDWAYRGHK